MKFNLKGRILPPDSVEATTMVFGLIPGIFVQFGQTEDDDVVEVEVLAAGGPESFAEIAEVLEMVVDLLRRSDE